MKSCFQSLRKRIVEYVTLLVLCFFPAACAAPLIAFGLGAAGGIAYYKYQEGQTIVVYEAPFSKTWDATLVALDQMQVRVESSSHSISSGKITAKRPDSQSVYISVTYQSADKTEVKIGVGSVGDKEGSDAIAKKIREILFES
ncbi:MAG: DUF3568 family protein [Desulfatiglandaceae bacterium]